MIKYFLDNWVLISSFLGGFLLLQFYGIFRVNRLTKNHMAEFLSMNLPDLQEAVCCKVVEYNKGRARIYYMTPKHQQGYLYTLIRESDNSWRVATPEELEPPKNSSRKKKAAKEAEEVIPLAERGYFDPSIAAYVPALTKGGAILVWSHTGQPGGMVLPYWYHSFLYKD